MNLRRRSCFRCVTCCRFQLRSGSSRNFSSRFFSFHVHDSSGAADGKRWPRPPPSRPASRPLVPRIRNKILLDVSEQTVIVPGPRSVAMAMAAVVRSRYLVVSTTKNRGSCSSSCSFRMSSSCSSFLGRERRRRRRRTNARPNPKRFSELELLCSPLSYLNGGLCEGGCVGR